MSYFKVNIIKSNKINSAITQLKINTTQKDLLLSLLNKFKYEQNIVINSKNNFVQKIYPGVNGCIFVGPDSKIINTTRIILTYLLKKSVKDNQYFGQVESNYKKLHDDILKGVEVNIISKSKNLKTDKFKLVEEVIKSTIIKDDIKGNKARSLEEFKVVNGVKSVEGHLIFLLENHPFKFNKTDLIIFEETNLKMYKQSFKDIIKSSGVLFGKENTREIEKPKTEEEKKREQNRINKNKIIKNSLDAFKKMFGEIHGVDISKFDFDVSSEELKILGKLDI